MNVVHVLCAVGLLLPLLHRRRHVGAHRRTGDAGRHAGERRPPARAPARAPRRSWPVLAPTLPLPLVEPWDGPTTVGLLAPAADPWFNEALTIFMPTLTLPSLCRACPQHN